MSEQAKKELDASIQRMFADAQSKLPESERAFTRTMCGNQHDGYGCTLEKGHAGNHIAHGMLGGIVKRWEPPAIRVTENCYYKDSGKGEHLMSGLPLPRDPDGVTRNWNFVHCSLHPATYGVFENCQINGKPIPDGPGCLWQYDKS